MIQTRIKPLESKAARLNESHADAPISEHRSQQIQVKWLESGKPVLEGQRIEGVETSLSHDDQFCLCVVGQGWQGCDIAPVTHRTQENWLSLLTPDRKALLEQLMLPDEASVNIAGTRIWAAIEAFSKAAGPSPHRALAIEKREGDTVLFRGSAAGRNLYILTFPIQLSQGPLRIVAVVAAP